MVLFLSLHLFILTAYLKFPLLLLLLVVCVCMICVRMWVRLCSGEHVGVRRSLCGVSFPLPPCGGLSENGPNFTDLNTS